MPQRIQLRRTKGWRKPEGAVVVSRPSRWGNPFKVSPLMGGWAVDASDRHHGVYESERAARQAAVDLFRLDLLWDFSRFADFREDYTRRLRGHDLACWCPLDQPCHGDVLLEIANSA